MNKDLLRQIIVDQQTFGLPADYISRKYSFHIEDYFKSNECVILVGVRRCGKSTLLQHIRSIQSQKNYFLNFDDDRLAQFTLESFQNLYEVFIELFGEQDVFYFDEIQNIDGWERFVRRLHDLRKKVFITGSNASMLSRELGTRLTGRYIQLEVYPFSFVDFIHFQKTHMPVSVDSVERLSTQERVLIKRIFNAYLQLGGFPEYIFSENKQRLVDLYEGILYRDVIVRHGLSNERGLKLLAHYIASNTGKTMTFNSLKGTLGIKNGSTIADYCHYLQDSFLVFLTNKFEYSLKAQINTAKKMYFIDSALSMSIGFRFSEDYGRLLENLVFLELKRRGYKNIYYHLDKHECDFIVQEGNQVVLAIQVTKYIETHTEQREVAGLVEAAEKYSPDSVLLLTDDQEMTLSFNEKSITVLPVWKWMLLD
jgi:predicted AAA+ superfamily ATPase